MEPSEPTSPRLRYQRLAGAGLDHLLRIATDDHVRRYLLDGELVDRAWCEVTTRASDVLFATRRVGLWLIAPAAGGAPIGFGGFHVFPEVSSEPQLLYALLPDWTGQGYATEIGTAMVELARRLCFPRVESAVDAPNAASLRVLEKLGFQRISETRGAFGVIHVLEVRFGT